MVDVTKEEKEVILQVLSNIIMSPHTNFTIKEKINYCSEVLNPSSDLGKVLFALVPDEKPYYAVFKSVIMLIKEKLLRQMAPNDVHKLIPNIRKAMITILSTIVDSQEVSEFDKIAICYEMINPKNKYIEMQFIDNEIKGKIKKTINSINNPGIQLSEARDSNNKNHSQLSPATLIQQLQRAVYLVLEKQIDNKAISASENITAWCDVISPTGQMGEILFSSLQESIFKAVLALVYIKLKAKIEASGNPIASYESLTSRLTEITPQILDKKYKNQITDLLSDIEKIKQPIQFSQKKHEIQRPTISFFDLMSGAKVSPIIQANSRQDESAEYKQLCNSVRAHKVSVPEKIRKCEELIPAIVQQGKNLYQALALIDRYLILNITAATDAITLRSIIENIHLPSSKENERGRCKKIVMRLECLRILLQTTNPNDSASNAPFVAVHSGIARCWNHIYSELMKGLSLISQDKIPAFETLSNSFNELNAMIQAITQPGRNTNSDYSDIATKANEILEMIKGTEQNAEFFLFEKYEELMEKLSKADSIFGVRDIFYKEVAEIDVQEVQQKMQQKMQQSDNIIMISENADNSFSSQAGENIEPEHQFRLG